MPSNQRKLRVALIGQGFMGKAHSNAFNQAGRFFEIPFELERKVICGRDPERLASMASQWGWAETATDWRSIVDRKDIDVVDIATPNALHAPIAIAAAEAGKIVLCEKPLARTCKEAGDMAAAAKSVRTMVWFNYRRVPAIAFAKRLIDEGRLGRIFHYRATYLQQWGSDPSRVSAWKLDQEQAGSGVTGDLLSHLLDTALWLNGPIAELSAAQHTFTPGRTVDDACMLLARFENGSVGTFEATRYAMGCRNRKTFEIHGSLASVRFDLENLNYLEVMDSTEPAPMQGFRKILVTGPGHPYSDQFWKPGHPIGYEHTFIAALADFLQALGNGTPFQPDFEDGQRVQLLLDAVERSAREGSWRRL